MSKIIREIWDKGASVYDKILQDVLPYQRSHEAIIDFLPKTGEISVLDLGAGTGLLSERILVSIPTSSVTCLDFSAEMMDKCKHRLVSFGSRVRYVCDDIIKWMPDQNYDAIVTCNTLIYKGINVGDCYAKFGNVLKSDGIFLNSTVLKNEDSVYLTEIMKKIKPPNALSPSKEATDFVQVPGKPISHCGEESLLIVLSQQEHLDLMTNAGLKSTCVWQYLFQAIIMGVKSAKKAFNPIAAPVSCC